MNVSFSLVGAGNGGGMLENSGATVAINDLLLQSHAGHLRFFPVWDATILGASSFTTLRTYGAFLVSASISGTGTVAPISLVSEQGETVVFESPWAEGVVPVVTETQSGQKIQVSKKPGDLWAFETHKAGQYKIVQS